MSWYAHALEKLQAGEQAEVRPVGNSMVPRVRSRARVTLKPLGADEKLRTGEIVLVKVKGRVYLHLICALDGERVQIANNRGHVNGWTSRANVYGRAVAIDNAAS